MGLRIHALLSQNHFLFSGLVVCKVGETGYPMGGRGEGGTRREGKRSD